MGDGGISEGLRLRLGVAVWAREGGGRIEVGGRIVGLLTASPGLVGADMAED